MTLKKKFNHLSFFDRPLLGLIYWKRIRITDGLDRSSDLIKNARSSADRHTKGKLLALVFTESFPEWGLLYDHARQGQITPKIMRNMRRSDLYFLAGHTFPHPALTQPKRKEEAAASRWLLDSTEEKWNQVTKLQGNAARAKTELERRNFVWTSTFVVLAALAGGFVGSGVWG